MKKLLILSLLVGMSACSSKNKTAETTTPAASTETVAAPAETKTDATSAKKENMGSASNCVMDKDTRIIEVKKTTAGGCDLFYTKFGDAKSVASAGFGTQYCEEVKDRIQTNLEKAGFTCK